MNLGELTDAAIGQVIPLTATEQLVNANKEFVKLMINKAYHLIESRTLWKFSEAEADISAAVGVRACADMPADMALTQGIYSHQLKKELDFHDERQKFFELNDTGIVHWYGLWKGELRWYPLPKQVETFTLRYYKRWADLVDDTDTPIIPDTWHHLLIDFASGQLARRLPPTGDRFLPHSKADPWIEDFHRGLEIMANSDLVLPTWDRVPNYGFEDDVLSLGEW